MIVIGIDCATDPKKVGIALADCDEGRCALVAVELGESQELLARKTASWLPSSGPVAKRSFCSPCPHPYLA